MEALDRRFEGAVRMPVDLLVQLSHDAGDGGELYDADAVNLGPEGLGGYRRKCDEVAAKGYEGFSLSA